MSIFILQDSVFATSVAEALEATLIEPPDPGTWPEALWHDDARLLVHVNQGPRRSQRQGLTLVKQLRCELGVTVPVLFLSFESEETLRSTPYGDMLTQPGQSFLRLPATVEGIREALHAVPAVAEPERYWRSAVAAALGILLEGPAVDPINDGPGPIISLLRYSQNGELDKAEVAEYLTSNQWWRRWSTALTDCRKRLTRLTAVPVECFKYLKRVEESLATVTAFAEQVRDLTQGTLTSQGLTAALHAAEELIDVVENLVGIRRGLKKEREANLV